MVQLLPSYIKMRTIPEYLEHQAKVFPLKASVIAFSGLKKAKMSLTYQDLNNRTNRLANSYSDIGIHKGDRIAIFMDNEQGLECILTFFATHKLGAVNVPINSRYVGQELEYILNHCEATALVTSDILLPRILEIIKECPQIKQLIIVGNQPGMKSIHQSCTIHNFQMLLENGNESKPNVLIYEMDDADWLYTSGTTAKPKGVMHTHGSALGTGYAVGGALQLVSSDIYQSSFPFFTSSGCHFNLLSALVFGATFIMDRKFDVVETLETIEAEKTTVYVGVPAVYTYILESGMISKYELSSLRLLDYGGAPMPKQVIMDLFKSFPGVELRQTYGLTEAGPAGTYLPGEYALSKLGSVGKSGMPLVEVKVVDENDREVVPYEVGQICYRSPANMRGYFKNEEATRGTLRDGWVYSGDLVYRDDDGFIYHVDRMKDIVIRGGFNISSLEVENCLYEHPAILEAAVVSKPHKNLGEDLKAFIVLKNGESTSDEAIISFCRQRLADFKIPHDIQFIDTLPRTPMGKVLKTELRKMV